MSELTIKLIRAQAMKLSKASLRYIISAQSETSEPVRNFQFRRAWELFKKAEGLEEEIQYGRF
jgi:hypothetical protein